MIELVDGANFEVVGCKYTEEERAAAIFTLGLYARLLSTGLLYDENNTVESDMVITESMLKSVNQNPDIIEPTVHTLLRKTYFPYLMRLQVRLGKTSTTGDQYEEACRRDLGIHPSELIANAIIARRIVKEESTSQEFVDFDLGHD